MNSNGILILGGNFYLRDFNLIVQLLNSVFDSMNVFDFFDFGLFVFDVFRLLDLLLSG